jgi:DNA-binding GntR family transcriptional regulator
MSSDPVRLPPTAPGELEVLRGLKIERSTTAERVASGLRTLIIKGNLVPGSPLREATLVDALGVSRNTIREAFRLLSRDGLVVHEMHRGVGVKRLRESDVRDIYRTRVPLEIMAIRASAGLPSSRLRPLRKVVEQASEALRAKDWNELATGDLFFHQRLVELLDSERINTFFEALLAELRLAFAIPTDPEAFLAPFLPWNERICDLLEHGRQDECEIDMRAYLAEAERVIQCFMQEGSDVSPRVRTPFTNPSADV